MEFLKEADLATEAYTYDKKNESKNGIKTTTLFYGECEVICTEVLNELAKINTGKEVGKYLTLVVGDVYKYTEYEKENFSDALSMCIKNLISTFKPCPKRFLVVGLGNEDIPADSLGSLVFKGLVPTAHLRDENAELYASLGYDLALLKTGVTGQSGLSAYEHIKSILPSSGCELVILIDSLLTFDESRLLKTIQISNTGILPGSGGGTKHTEKITKDSLLLPVISLGVPTAIKLSKNKSSQLYTPCDSLFAIRELSKIISKGINKAIKQYF